MISGRNVVIYSDKSGNFVCVYGMWSFLLGLLTGAEAATRKGSTKNFDQHSLVHGMWKRFAELKVGVWVMRVPTDDNIADCPSRSLRPHFHCKAYVPPVFEYLPGNNTSS